jgi:EPS-associated MarR family transcriptional regulator
LNPESCNLKLLRYLESKPDATQRELAGAMGISLGKLNYCLKALVAKGWVKAGNFSRNPDKKKYAYLLTPQGIEAKARLTVQFLQIKMRDYDALRREIAELKADIRAGDQGNHG